MYLDADGKDASHPRERPTSSWHRVALTLPELSRLLLTPATSQAGSDVDHPHPSKGSPQPCHLTLPGGGSPSPSSKQARHPVYSSTASVGTQADQPHFSSSLGPGQASPSPRRKGFPKRAGNKAGHLQAKTCGQVQQHCHRQDIQVALCTKLGVC